MKDKLFNLQLTDHKCKGFMGFDLNQLSRRDLIKIINYMDIEMIDFRKLYYGNRKI